MFNLLFLHCWNLCFFCYYYKDIQFFIKQFTRALHCILNKLTFSPFEIVSRAKFARESFHHFKLLLANNCQDGSFIGPLILVLIRLKVSLYFWLYSPPSISPSIDGAPGWLKLRNSRATSLKLYEVLYWETCTEWLTHCRVIAQRSEHLTKEGWCADWRLYDCIIYLQECYVRSEDGRKGVRQVKRLPRSEGEETKEGWEHRRGCKITSSSIARLLEGCKHLISHSNTVIQSDPLLLKRYVKRGVSAVFPLFFWTVGLVDPTRPPTWPRCGNFSGKFVAPEPFVEPAISLSWHYYPKRRNIIRHTAQWQ